jgi:serine protease Do
MVHSGGISMTCIRQTAMAGALVLAAGVAPGSVAQGQSRDSRNTIAWTLQGSQGSRIGVTVQDLEESDARDVKSGVVVESVDPKGPGDKAGLKAGDAIVEFDGDRVRSVRQFRRLVQESASGRAVPLVVSRSGQRVNVNVTPEPLTMGDDFGVRLLDAPRVARPAIPPTPPTAPTPRAAPPPPPAPFDWYNNDGPLTIITGRARLGIVTETLNSQLADYFGVKDGALVKSVQDGSAAAKAGIKAGDVITSVNGTHVSDSSDATRVLGGLDNGADFTVEVVRDHKTQTLKGKVEAPATRRRA